MSLNAGHEKFNSDVDIATLIISSGIDKVLYSPASAFGLRNFRASNAKQRRLFSFKRVVRLKTPPVASERSIPVKLLMVPVFPPILLSLILVDNLVDRSRYSPSKLGILQEPVKGVKVKFHQTIVYWRLVPVLRDSLPSLPIGKVSFFAVDGEEITNYFLGYSTVSSSLRGLTVGLRSYSKRPLDSPVNNFEKVLPGIDNRHCAQSIQSLARSRILDCSAWFGPYESSLVLPSGPC